MKLEKYIEHLTEMGKVALLGDENIEEMIKALSKKGYQTYFDTSDKEYLVLI